MTDFEFQIDNFYVVLYFAKLIKEDIEKLRTNFKIVRSISTNTIKITDVIVLKMNNKECL